MKLWAWQAGTVAAARGCDFSFISRGAF